MKALISINILLFLFLQFGRSTPPVIDIISNYDLALLQAAKQLETHPDTLRALYWIESRNNPKAINPYTRAHGMIQWMPSTAKHYGLDTTMLKSMSAIEQLPYEVKYLMPAKGSDLVGFYFRIFFPAAINKPDNWILRSRKLSARRVARYNQGFDVNNDGVLQVWEVKSVIRKIRI